MRPIDGGALDAREVDVCSEIALSFRRGCQTVRMYVNIKTCSRRRVLKRGSSVKEEEELGDLPWRGEHVHGLVIPQRLSFMMYY